MILLLMRRNKDMNELRPVVVIRLGGNCIDPEGTDTQSAGLQLQI